MRGGEHNSLVLKGYEMQLRGNPNKEWGQTRKNKRVHLSKKWLCHLATRSTLDHPENSGGDGKAERSLRSQRLSARK